MRKKVFYVYNPNTLSYERVYPSFRKRMATVFRHLLSGIILGGILFSVLNYFVDSPREKMLKRENQQMRSQYKLLSRRLDEALDVMADVRERDAICTGLFCKQIRLVRQFGMPERIMCLVIRI